MSSKNGTLKIKVDRIAVAITSHGKSKLLRVPKLHHGTGDNMANVVFDEIVDWNLTNVIIGMCCDTTNSNTGWKLGAATTLQTKYLREQLIFFPCRHIFSK